LAVLVSTRTAGKVAVGAFHACFTCRPKTSVSSAPDGLAGLCRRRTLKSLGASISGAVDVARVRRFARVRDLWGIPGIGHASTAVWWGPAFDDPWIVLHGASLDDRTPCERLRGIQDSNLAGVPEPLIWPGYPAAGACCTLHVHAKEQRQMLNADRVSSDDTAPYPRRTHAPPIPSDHHASPRPPYSEGWGEDAPHPPCALGALLRLPRGVGGVEHRTVPEAQGKVLVGLTVGQGLHSAPVAPQTFSPAHCTHPKQQQTSRPATGGNSTHSHRTEGVVAPCPSILGRSLARRPRRWHR